jgi:hypothetical protein
MRLSLTKAAHVDVGEVPRGRKSGYAPVGMTRRKVALSFKICEPEGGWVETAESDVDYQRPQERLM